MDNLQKFSSQVRNRLLLAMVSGMILVLAAAWLGSRVLELNDGALLPFLVALIIVLGLLLSTLVARRLSEPVKSIWQAVLHIAPDTANIPAPQLSPKALGAELVANLVSHVYQLASVVEKVEKTATVPKPSNLSGDFVASTLPLPLVILGPNRNIIFANKAMLDYIGKSDSETIGQDLYSVLDISFGTTNTFDKWLENAKANQAVASHAWDRVRLNLPTTNTTRLFDLAAYYNKGNPEGFETMLILFDHTARYSEDDQALSFVALAVHELRTPITLLRGYIEALDEELTGKIDPELSAFIRKMNASAQSLTAFINNMLSVARVESDQLILKLREEKWADIVEIAVRDARVRSNVLGIELVVKVDPSLPTVGVDRIGVYEVLTNLIDNAVKYSGHSKEVIITSNMSSDGMVETTIQDFGVGVATAVMPNLFEKFYRSHRSRSQVGGTGLGLYLAKAIIEAHGGHVWVRSKEGEGSTFGFTVVPYTKLSAEKKAGEGSDITRSAHGWIKNHSLYSG